MKKLLLTLFSFALILNTAHAQCVPDTTISGIFVPPAGSIIDSANNLVILPRGTVNQPYSTVIHFRIPADTFMLGQTVPITQVKLDGVVGLPSTITLGCTPGNCVFPGGTFGCGEISGTPTTPDSVELKLAIEYTISIGGTNPTPIKDTIHDFYLVIDPFIGLDENSFSKESVKVFPNPAQRDLNILFNADQNQNAQLQISNIIGSVVYETNTTTQVGENNIHINISDLKPGIYLYSLNVDDTKTSGRFSVSR